MEGGWEGGRRKRMGRGIESKDGEGRERGWGGSEEGEGVSGGG